MSKRKPPGEEEHVFFPGGRQSDLLNSWERYLASATPIIEPWSLDDIREMLTALDAITDDGARYLLPQYELNRARRVHALCGRATERDNLQRATKLATYLMELMAHAFALDDMKDAKLGRQYRKLQSSHGSVGAQKRWKSGEARRLMMDIVERLSCETDQLGDPLKPNELWPLLYSELDEIGLNPTETSERKYKYGESESIAYNAFRKQISRLRNPK